MTKRRQLTPAIEADSRLSFRAFAEKSSFVTREISRLRSKRSSLEMTNKAAGGPVCRQAGSMAGSSSLLPIFDIPSFVQQNNASASLFYGRKTKKRFSRLEFKIKGLPDYFDKA